MPNVLLLNSEASFRAAVPGSQGRRLEVWGPGHRSPLLASGSPTSSARHARQAIVSMPSRSSERAKGKPQSTANVCSVPCPKCRRRLRGDSAAQLQDVYSKLSHPPSSISNRISGTYFRRRHFKFRCLNLELHPSLSIPCRRNNCFLLARLFSQSL